MSPALVSPAAAAVGTAALTVSGCVWYVPALVDLRAGPDRPASRRLAAAACLTGWATALAVALLLLAGGPWRAAGAAVALGGSAAVTLRMRAALRRRREARRRRCAGPPSSATRRRPPPAPGRPRPPARSPGGRPAAWPPPPPWPPRPCRCPAGMVGRRRGRGHGDRRLPGRRRRARTAAVTRGGGVASAA
ncbi:hypothetical protein [Streptomyces sp. CC210A]|uniref:hypothetical protein n=1 Tax=Streptomyces sp. CC210A TaxID=2898184 RepID=UPI001F2C98F1|nr:hypothetical protein [Streptomyces sp. CC210A]